MGYFGFDFNRDGTVDSLELLMTMKTAGIFDGTENEAGYCNANLTNSSAEIERRKEHEREKGIERSILEDYSTNLRYSRMELEDTLRILELEEPDYSSPDYDSWNNQHEELLQRLERIDNNILETDETLSYSF